MKNCILCGLTEEKTELDLCFKCLPILVSKRELFWVRTGTWITRVGGTLCFGGILRQLILLLTEV